MEYILVYISAGRMGKILSIYCTSTKSIKKQVEECAVNCTLEA